MCGDDDGAAGGLVSAAAVAAVSPAGFPIMLQRPGSIPPEILAAEQQSRVNVTMQPHQQHATHTSLATRVCTTV